MFSSRMFFLGLFAEETGNNDDVFISIGVLASIAQVEVIFSVMGASDHTQCCQEKFEVTVKESLQGALSFPASREKPPSP